MLYRLNRVCVAAMVIMALVNLSATAQSSLSGSYKSFNLLKGKAIIDMKTGNPKSLTEGPHIQLVPKSASDIPVDIFADTVTFEWNEANSGGKMSLPARILLTGHVRVENTLGILTSSKAAMDFNKNLITFSGQPVCTLRSNGQRVKGEKIIFDIQRSEIEIPGVEMEMALIEDAISDTDALPLYTQSDIQDWAGFFETLKAQQKDSDANPGKRLYAKLNADMQAGLDNARVDSLVENKEAFLTALNSAVKASTLYDEASWEGIQLPTAAVAQLNEDSLSSKDQVLLNRQLLKAAYPAYITR